MFDWLRDSVAYLHPGVWVWSALFCSSHPEKSNTESENQFFLNSLTVNEWNERVDLSPSSVEIIIIPPQCFISSSNIHTFSNQDTFTAEEKRLKILSYPQWSTGTRALEAQGVYFLLSCECKWSTALQNTQCNSSSLQYSMFSRELLVMWRHCWPDERVEDVSERCTCPHSNYSVNLLMVSCHLHLLPVCQIHADNQTLSCWSENSFNHSNARLISAHVRLCQIQKCLWDVELKCISVSTLKHVCYVRFPKHHACLNVPSTLRTYYYSLMYSFSVFTCPVCDVLIYTGARIASQSLFCK